MDGSQVEYKVKIGTNTKGTKSRHVSLNKTGIDASFLYPSLGSAQGLGNDLDTCDPPAPGRELDAPDATAAAEVECGPLAALTLSFLTVKEGSNLLSDRKRRHFFPWRHAKPAGYFVEDAHHHTSVSWFTRVMSAIRRLCSTAGKITGKSLP